MFAFRGGAFSLCWFSLLVLLLPWRAHARLVESLSRDTRGDSLVSLTEVNVDIRVHDDVSLVNYDLAFAGSHREQTALGFLFSFPQQAILDDFAVWAGGEWKSSSVVHGRERSASGGRRMFTSSALGVLEPVGGNSFSIWLRALTPGQPFRLRFALAIPSEFRNGARTLGIPLDLGSVPRLSLKLAGIGPLQVTGLANLSDPRAGGDVQVSREYTDLPESPASLSVSWPASTSPRAFREDAAGEKAFSVAFSPNLPALAKPAPAEALVVWDRSASAAREHEARLAVLRSYLNERKPRRVRLLLFGLTAEVEAKSFAASDWQGIRRALENRPYDGATSFERMLASLVPLAPVAGDLLLFTDGVESYSPQAPSEWEFPRGDALQVYLIAPSFGDPALGRLAVRLGAALIPQEHADFMQWNSLTPWTLASVGLSENLATVLTEPAGVIVPGQELRVRGLVKTDGEHRLSVRFVQGKRELRQTYSFHTAQGAHPGIGKVWAAGRIHELLDDPVANDKEVEALSLRHDVVSPFAVRLLFADCEEFRKHGLPMPRGCGREDASGEGKTGWIRRSSPLANLVQISDGRTRFAPTVPGPTGPLPVRSDGFLIGTTEDLREERAKPSPFLRMRGMGMLDYDFESIFSEVRSAKEIYQLFLKRRSEFAGVPRYYFFVGELLAQAGAPDLATRVLSNLLELRPGEVRWMKFYALPLLAWKCHGEALAFSRVLERFVGEGSGVLRDRGLALERSGKTGEALEHFSRLAEPSGRLSGIAALEVARLLRTLPVPRDVLEKSREPGGARVPPAPELMITATWDEEVSAPRLTFEESGSASQGQENGMKNVVGHRGNGVSQLVGTARDDSWMVLEHGHAGWFGGGAIVRVDVAEKAEGAEKFNSRAFFFSDPNGKRWFHAVGEARNPLQHVKRLLDDNQNDEALRTLLRMPAARAPGEEARRLFYLALVHGRSGLVAKAVALNEKALRLDPGLTIALFNSACFEAIHGNRDNALRHLTAFRAALLKLGEVKAKEFSEILRAEPSLGEVRAGLAFNMVMTELLTAHFREEP